MKASDLLKKTTITPDDDPRSKLRDEEEEDDEKDSEELEEELEDSEEETEEDPQAGSGQDKSKKDPDKVEDRDLDEEEEEVVREHETFEDKQSLRSDDLKQSLRSDDLEELDTDDETSDETDEPKPTFKRETEGGPSPKYHNIAGFAAVGQSKEEDSQAGSGQEEEIVNPHPDTPETMDDLVNMDSKEEEREKGKEVENIEEENMDIPNLKSQNMPSSGIYTSHNGTQREFSTFNPPPRRGKSKNLLLQLVVLALIALAVIGGTVYALKMQFSGFGASNASPTPSAEASPSPTPTPSPEVKITREDITVRILNGTSTSGLAASVSAKLKDLGYKVEKTGNATNSAFTQTQVRARADKAMAIEQIISDLAPNFEAASSSSSLKASDTSDIEVILGSK